MTQEVSVEVPVFDKDRIDHLRKETCDFREVVKARLAAHFKDRTAEEVVRIMADWMDLDSLLELDDRAAIARRILSGE